MPGGQGLKMQRRDYKLVLKNETKVEMELGTTKTSPSTQLNTTKFYFKTYMCIPRTEMHKPR